MLRVCFLLLLGSSLCTAMCDLPLSLWCSSGETAKSCGVHEQCRQAMRKAPDAPPVNLTLYFESLCPDCKNFFATQLYDTWEALGTDVLNLTLVPYGNARETKDGDKWKFECQHGDQECIGNLIETCAINILKDIKVYFPFINCIEGKSGMPEKDAEECASQQQIDLNPIITCANGPMGNALEHQMALQTDALNPPHKYVPWVTLNGVHTEKLERKAEEDLLNLICDTYKGPTPQKCLQRFSKSKRCYQD
ncbi:gamma-interferon-inducible lysosomal thiol reductase-like [Mya arenaria]|uniref:gamma-interferon-inducible lysosomal thiol reductase-like n=1 Tax=Mya arenaria TaxID=6604 RepID=UPI0022E36441|nr:gamma-interferon-inducible lysosomal thiol reductase-like [Mya arenaria]XP_052761476.1 gamma-interferon-inducible lysosomal thiol reductase-like [Mya arenaria]